MQKHPIGKTGLALTPIGFGTAPLGGMPDTYGHSVDEATARATVGAIFDSPVNLMDTSRNYGAGRSEVRIGAVNRERDGLPAGFVLSTKLDRDMDTGRFDAARARLSLEKSLTVLGLDHIPMLHLHDPEHPLDMTEIARPAVRWTSCSVWGKRVWPPPSAWRWGVWLQRCCWSWTGRLT